MMELYAGYVFQGELAIKVGVTVSMLCTINTSKKKMGGLTCFKKSDLPSRYKEAAELCQDLNGYCSYNYLSRALGMSRDYLCTLENYNKKQNKSPFKSIKVGHIRLFRLNKEFVTCVEKSLTPFKIKDKEDEEYAKEIIEMQGLKIGFY
jgi:hypothetical protein